MLALILAITTTGAQSWRPAGDKLKTPWAEKVNPDNPWPEYPRPQMERTDWLNLNGLWQYAIQPKGRTEPTKYDGQILVPFCPESSLSGVMKSVLPTDELWYHRSFTVPARWKGQRILLNFGAVDWRADVFVNGVLIGTHTGGYTPFTLDLTPYLKADGEQQLTLRVWDPTDKGEQPIGKQRLEQIGVWYTPVSGIWQTVWLEPVSRRGHIENVRSVADIDNHTLSVTVGAKSYDEGQIVKVTLLDKGRAIAEAKGVAGEPLRLTVGDMHLWSPADPYLYDLRATLCDGSQTIDSVKSYTAMRKVSAERDEHGYMRICLNNKPLFNNGTLDQGWWPDGLYTAPTDEAMLYDIHKLRDLGFNMMRKHIKVEPARYYYHCDQAGMLVWQDMPSQVTGGNTYEPLIYNGGTDVKRSESSKRTYWQELKEVVDLCSAFPSVIVWVPFNEGWCQFDTEKVAAWLKDYDPSRLVNPASGGNHRPCGDIMDMHIYPEPKIQLFDPARVNVIGEYGGIGLPVKGHLWRENKNWGYVQFKNTAEVTAEYVKYAGVLKQMAQRGISGAVYTQTTDVEGELNGLITYDRKVVKVDEAKVRAANKAVIDGMEE